MARSAACRSTGRRNFLTPHKVDQLREVRSAACRSTGRGRRNFLTPQMGESAKRGAVGGVPFHCSAELSDSDTAKGGSAKRGARRSFLTTQKVDQLREVRSPACRSTGRRNLLTLTPAKRGAVGGVPFHWSAELRDTAKGGSAKRCAVGDVPFHWSAELPDTAKGESTKRCAVGGVPFHWSAELSDTANGQIS